MKLTPQTKRNNIKRWPIFLVLSLEMVLLLAVMLNLRLTPIVLADTPIYVRTDGNDTACNGIVDQAYSAPAAPGCAVKTIQKGLDLVSPGGVVNVADGVYEGKNITIDKPVTLTGDRGDPSEAGPGLLAPVLDGVSGIGDGFLIAPGLSNITIEGFVIRNFGSSGPGIGVGVKAYNPTITPTTNITLRDNRFDNCVWAGIMVFNDGQSVFEQWNVTYNIVHMGLWSPNTNVYGIELTNASSSTIAYNVASGGYANTLITARGAVGSYHVAQNNIIQDNTLSNAARYNIQLMSYTDSSITLTHSVDLADMTRNFSRSMAAYKFGGKLQRLDNAPASRSVRDNAATGKIGALAVISPSLKDIDIIGNTLSNTIVSTDSFGLAIIAYIDQAILENLDVMSNTIAISVDTPNIITGSAGDFGDVSGYSSFSHNWYRISGAVGTGSSFDALALYGPATGEWLVYANNLDGNLLGSAGSGVRVFAGTVNVRGNTITRFARGIYSEDASVAAITASFNRIVANTGAGVYNDGLAVLSAPNNWWGCNAGPGYSGCDSALGSSVVITAPWLTLQLTAFPSLIPLYGSSTLTADLTINSTGLNTTGSGHIPDETEVAFTAKPGGVQPALTGTIEGIAKTTFTPIVTGTATISATVDNQTISTKIKIMPCIIHLPLILK